MSILINILLAILVIVSLLIILVTLMQRPKNEGLGAAFGGGMTENLFGAQTTNVLAKFTTWLGASFFALTLTLSVLYARQSSSKSKVQEQLLNAAKPAAEASATPEAAASAAATPGATASADATPEAAASADATATPEATASPEASASPSAPVAAPSAAN